MTLLRLAVISLLCFSSSFGFADETKPATKATEVTQVTLLGTDQMKFNLSEIKVKKGSKVELTLKHDGKLPVNVMGHNFVLLKQGVDIAQFSMKAMQAKETGYVSAEQAKDVIAKTEVIGGGASTTITFDAPAPGVYDFICSFPGHYAMMKGKFIVE